MEQKNNQHQFDDNKKHNRFNNNRKGQRNNTNMGKKGGKFNDNNKGGFRKNNNNNNNKQNNRGQKNFNRGYQPPNGGAPVMTGQMFKPPTHNPQMVPQYMNPMMGTNDWRNMYMPGMTNQSFQYNNNRNTNQQGDKNLSYPQYMNYPTQPNYQYVYPPYTDQTYNQYAYYNSYPQTQPYTNYNT